MDFLWIPMDSYGFPWILEDLPSGSALRSSPGAGAFSSQSIRKLWQTSGDQSFEHQRFRMWCQNPPLQILRHPVWCKSDQKPLHRGTFWAKMILKRQKDSATSERSDLPDLADLRGQIWQICQICPLRSGRSARKSSNIQNPLLHQTGCRRIFADIL